LVDFRYIDLYQDIKEHYPTDYEGLPYLKEFLEWSDNKYENSKVESRRTLTHHDEKSRYDLALDYFSTYHCKDCDLLNNPGYNDFIGECKNKIHKNNLGANYKPSGWYGRDCYIYNTLITKTIEKRLRKINRIVENEVRQSFNFKKIGEAWTSESILYAIIKRIFPNYNVRRHYRPGILEGLELDIYIEELNVGIEYQGLQHFKPVKHWGGEEGLIKTKERDKRKKKLCKLNSIKLIYFDYTEGLTEDFVTWKIKGILNDVPQSGLP